MHGANSYTYDAFGNQLTANEADINPFRYTGEYTDAETGFVYLRNRYYDPQTGRFINEDTYWTTDNMIYGDKEYEDGETKTPDVNAIMQSNNLYVYCMNNPVVYIDPLGFNGKIYVIYYDNPGSGFKTQVDNSPYYDKESSDVIMISVTSSDDFIEAWNSMSGDIDYVYLYLHGGEGVLYFRGESLSFTGEKSFSDLKSISVNEKVYLLSCHGGEGAEGNNVAWMLASKTGTTVRACRGGVSYSKIFGKYYARTDFTGPWLNFYYKNNKAKWIIGK